jgi:hypothetical protein
MKWLIKHPHRSPIPQLTHPRTVLIRAEHRNKMFPVPRDVGKLSLSTRNGDKYIMHVPGDHLRSVSERVNK